MNLKFYEKITGAYLIVCQVTLVMTQFNDFDKAADLFFENVGGPPESNPRAEVETVELQPYAETEGPGSILPPNFFEQTNTHIVEDIMNPDYKKVLRVSY